MGAEVEGRYVGLKYTSTGNGLRRNGHTFEANMTPYLPPLTKKGVPYKNFRSSKCINWWQAQCLFRGLPHKGDWEVLQASLSSGPDIMIQPLLDLEARLNFTCEEKNELLEAEADQQKAEYQREMEEKAV
jgi:hypothetical protein